MDCVKRLLVGSFLVLLGSLACVQVSFAQANPLNFGNNFFVTGDYVVAGAQGMTTHFSNGYELRTGESAELRQQFLRYGRLRRRWRARHDYKLFQRLRHWNVYHP